MPTVPLTHALPRPVARRRDVSPVLVVAGLIPIALLALLISFSRDGSTGLLHERVVQTTGTLVTPTSQRTVRLATPVDMEPGVLMTSQITLANDGDAPARMSLQEADVVEGAGGRALRVSIAEGERALYRGTVGGMPLGGVVTSDMAPGETRTITVRARLDVDASPGAGEAATYFIRPAG